MSNLRRQLPLEQQAQYWTPSPDEARPKHKSIGERVRYPQFALGETVVMTEYAKKHIGVGRARSAYGEVIGVDRSRLGITVLRDGLKGATHYWSGFWRHLRPYEEWPERNVR